MLFFLVFFFFPNFFSFTRSKDTVASLEGLANEEHTTETNKIAAALMKKELMKSKDKVSWFIAFNFFNRFPPFFPFYSLLLLRLFRRVIPPPRGSHCWQGAQPPYHSLCIAGGSSDMLPLSHYAIFTPFFNFFILHRMCECGRLAALQRQWGSMLRVRHFQTQSSR